jgi:protein involved in polysaccharide export with SLBB domain
MKNKIILLMLLFCSMNFAQESSLLRGGQNDALVSSGISVTLGGSFIINGTFTASPLERVDQFVTRMFNQAKTQTLSYKGSDNSFDQVNLKFENYAKRNIRLKRISGEEIIIDLEKFRLTGNFKFNPYLKNDDILIFPPVDLDRNFISIEGAVNNPVKFQCVEGDKLSDALLFAQGISPAYNDVKQVELVRLDYSGNINEVKKIDINSDIALAPGDRIRVLADETNKKDYRALVLGEVHQPGYISIGKDSVTVRDIIARVGGFKSSADLDNAELIRSTDSYSFYKKDMLTRSFEHNEAANQKIEGPLYDNNELEELLMSRMAYLQDEDTLYFKIDNKLRFTRGTALVDFTSLDKASSVSSKFIVKDGDVILIPAKKNFVYVFGQVVKPGYVEYVPGKDIGYYIEETGGYGQLARDKEDISVINAKTRAWKTVGKDEKNININPGDYIWVPKKTPRTFSYFFDLYGKRIAEVASIVSTIVTIILLTRK